MNYRDLKIGKHGLPTWVALAPIVLRFTERQGEWQGKKLKIAVADDLELPADLRLLMYSRTSSINIIEDRVGWTISELSTAGILDRTRRGYYQVTELGRKLLDGPDEINRKLIHAQPLYVQHLAELKERQGRKLSVGSDVSEELPASEMLSQQVEAYNDEVATSLLQKIMESEPEFFEELVVKLLVAMGYKGPNGSAWVTQQSNDGGIDGVINQDALGTSTVYVQAKRYNKDSKVLRPAIDSFYGALSRNHADRGVFITTSGFSAAAVETAREFSIVLVDGIQLTDLMLQYRVGVQVKKNLELFEIDKDFFED